MRSVLLLIVTGGLFLYSIYGNKPYSKNHPKHMGTKVTAMVSDDDHKTLG